MTTLRAIFFDVGETLIDETRIWAGWADWLGVPRLTFFAAIGACIERGEDHIRAFDLFRPGFNLEREIARRADAGIHSDFGSPDLYPDVVPCFEQLKAEGYLLGIAGNQPARAEGLVRALGLPADVVATSEGWGVEKPSPAFFARLAESVSLPPSSIAYIGDRVDNDVIPARSAGLLSVFLKRGPWGYLQSRWPEAGRAQIRLDSLSELPDALRAWETGRPQ
jgi:FMN phosphatase YigB (HAD superfamily)